MDIIEKVQVKPSGQASCEEGVGATLGRERATQKSRAIEDITTADLGGLDKREQNRRFSGREG